MSDSQSPLFTDLYQLAMLQAYHAYGLTRTAVFELFVRTLPPRALVEPEVALLLDVDREYRKLARAERLPKIAPKRFNPSGEAWLAILHAERGAWHFTALYSNTARAHELNKTRDWVVMYFYRDNQAEGQRTIVTETHGPLEGLRVVRGREAECRSLYAMTAAKR